MTAADHVSADTDDLDEFADYGRQAQRSLYGMLETLSRQRNYLAGAGFPYHVNHSEIRSLDTVRGSMVEIDRFVTEISTALKSFGEDVGAGVFRAPTSLIDDIVDGGALAWRNGKPTDDELYHLGVLALYFEDVLGEKATGSDIAAAAADLQTAVGRARLRERLLADGVAAADVDYLVADLAAAVQFYSDNIKARDLLDAAGDDNPHDVDDVFSLGDVTERIYDRRMEVARALSGGIVTHDCLHPDATPSAQIRQRIMDMTAADAATFREAYGDATGSELLYDVLPRPIGSGSWEHDWNDSYRVSELQKGDLAFELAAKLAPELVDPYLGPAQDNTDGLVVDGMDAMVIGSTLSVRMQWAAALPHPSETHTIHAIVYVDGVAVTNHAGNPRRFVVGNDGFDYKLDGDGDVKVVFEVKDRDGKLRFFTYHTTATADRETYATDRLAELAGPPLSVEQTVAALEARIASTQAALIQARADGTSFREVGKLEDRLAEEQALLGEYRDRFDRAGRTEPLEAVLVVDENSVTVPLSLHIEPNGHGGHGWIITDMTNPANPRVYRTDSGSVDQAFRKFLDDSNLPPGQIAAINPETGVKMTGYADGSSSWQKFSDGLSTGSLVLFVVGGVAYLSTPLTGPGGAAVGTWSWAGAGVLGAGGAVLNTADRIEHGQFELASRETFLDAVDIIGGATVVGGTVTRSGKWVAVATGVDTSTEVAATVIVAAEYYDQIQEIQNSDLTPIEKQEALDALYLQAAATGAIVFLGGRAGRQSTPTTGSTQPVLDGAAMDRLIDTHGRSQAVWATSTPVGEAPLTEAQVNSLLTTISQLGNGPQGAILKGYDPALAYHLLHSPSGPADGRTPLERAKIMSSNGWRTFNHQLDEQFFEVLDDFGGDPRPPKGFRGGEGQLFLSAQNPRLALKRWHGSRAADFDQSVAAMVDAHAAVTTHSELAEVMAVTKVHSTGPDWIIRDFDPRSRPLGDALADGDLRSEQAFTQAIAALEGTTDDQLRIIYQRLTRPGGPSANIHWSPTTGKLLVIDMM